MYEVDHLDRVIELQGLPQASVGAPCPAVLSDEHTSALAYYVQEIPDDWDGTDVRVVDPVSSDEPVAIVQLTGCYATMFGPPNDEALHGHPLADRGLKPYSTARVASSSWIRRLARMNSVHPDHRDAAFDGYQHLVFAFHDSTFEVICRDLSVTLARGSISSVIPRMIKLLDWQAG